MQTYSLQLIQIQNDNSAELPARTFQAPRFEGMSAIRAGNPNGPEPIKTLAYAIMWRLYTRLILERVACNLSAGSTT